MINKRNFFKTLSSAVLGTLMVGNCSNVWMMEGYESVVDNNKKLGSAILKAKIQNKVGKYISDKGVCEKFSRNLAYEIINKINPLNDDAAESIATYIVRSCGLKLRVYSKLGYDCIKIIATRAVDYFLNESSKQ